MVDYTLSNNQDDWGNYPATKAFAIQESRRRDYEKQAERKAARRAKIKNFFTKK